MILIFLSIIFLTIINYGFGFLLKKFLRTETENFALISFLGIAGITVLETVLAFFFPLNSYMEIAFIILGLCGFLMNFFKNKLHFNSLIINELKFYFFFFVIVFSASFMPYLYDHYSYYVPTISVLKEIGFVKGIYNLDLLLGQTSFWHIYQAGFSHFTDSFLRINAYLLFLFLIYIFEKKQWNFLLFFPFFLLFVQQPSPDLPVMIFTLIIINEIILKKNNLMILYLSIFAVCIKPIVFWLPVLVVYDLIKQKKSGWKMSIPIVIFGFLFIAKNLYLFGFPIFPVSFPDFGLAWKPSEKILTYSSQIGLMKSYDMTYSYQQILEFNFFERIFNWFTIGYKSVFNFGILVCLVVLGFFAFRKKNKFYKILFVCLLIKTIVILSFSVQYRFFLDLYAVVIYLIFRKISEKKSVVFSLFFSGIILLIFSFPNALNRNRELRKNKIFTGFSISQIWKPTQFSGINIAKEYQLGNLKFNSSKTYNYQTPFPSIPLYNLELYQYYGIFPQRFGNGFVQKNLSEEEKRQLGKIISEMENSKP